MNKLSSRERQIVVKVFEICSKIAHAQAGNEDIESDSNVSVVWKMAAIIIHQQIEAEKSLYLKSFEHDQLR